MSTNAGNLLWNRLRLTVPAATTLGPVTTDFDLGICQVGQAFENSSIAEPNLGIPGTSAPLNGALPASRVMIIPEPPLAAWANLTISEPYFHTGTNTVHVAITNASTQATPVLLAWDPHTSVGPGQADTYNPDLR